jgi:hypothetical protein
MSNMRTLVHVGGELVFRCRQWGPLYFYWTPTTGQRVTLSLTKADAEMEVSRALAHAYEEAKGIRCPSITYGGNPVVVRCAREAGHRGSHATAKELRCNACSGIDPDCASCELAGRRRFDLWPV